MCCLERGRSAPRSPCVCAWQELADGWGSLRCTALALVVHDSHAAQTPTSEGIFVFNVDCPHAGVIAQVRGVPLPTFASPSFTEPETLLFSHATQATPSSAPQLLPFSAAAVERYDLRSLAVDLECAADVDAIELLLTFETTDDRDHAWSLVERPTPMGTEAARMT